jgi:hypothetical protein
VVIVQLVNGNVDNFLLRSLDELACAGSLELFGIYNLVAVQLEGQFIEL